MSADLLEMISLICYIAAGVLFVLALFLFIYLKIPRVIGDLSGRTAARNIAKMRAENEKGGAKAFRPGKVNVERGPITETEKGLKTAAASAETETMEMTAHASAAEETVYIDGDTATAPMSGGAETAPMAAAPAPMGRGSETEELLFRGDTAPMKSDVAAAREQIDEYRNRREAPSPGATTQSFTPRPRPEATPSAPAPSALDETEMLGATEALGETEMLGGTELLGHAPKTQAAYPIKLLEEVMLIHTDEVIA